VVGCKRIDFIIRALMLLTSSHSSSRADAGLGRQVWFTSWQCFVPRDAEAVLQLENIYLWQYRVSCTFCHTRS
jgi:hypothetical protein